LIANWPGRIKAGSSNDNLVDFSDWLPSLAEIGVGKVGHKIDGISFAPALFGLSGSKWKVRPFAFSERKGGTAWVRTQRYKLYNNGQLYDVAKDAMEKNPIKNAAGTQLKAQTALRAAFTKLNYPNIK